MGSAGDVVVWEPGAVPHPPYGDDGGDRASPPTTPPFHRWWRLAVGLLVVAGALLGLWIYLSQASPTRVSGELTRFGDVSFSYDERGDASISPVCGCYRRQPDKIWRGISFATRAATIDRRGTSPYTAYVLTATSPEPIGWKASQLLTSAQIYTLRRDPGATGRFTPRDLLRARAPVGWRIAHRARQLVTHLTLMSRRPLHVGLLGPTPVAAWLPARGSHTRLRSSGPAFPGERPIGAIVDDQRPPTDAPASDGLRYSSGDFLGPDLVFWSTDPAALLGSSFDLVARAPGRGDTITAVVIRRPPFSTRVAVVPQTEVDRRHWLARWRSRPNLVPVGSEPYPMGAPEPGRARVRVSSPLTKSEYERMYRGIARRNTVALPIDPMGGEPFDDLEQLRGVETRFTLRNDGLHYAFFGEPYSTDPLKLEFRYPPLPRNDGFGVFGPLRELRMTAAAGTLAVGGRRVELGPRQALDLHDLEQMLKDGAVPVPIEAGRRAASFGFQASSRVAIDGKDQTRFVDRHADDIELVTLILSISSALAGLWAARLHRRAKHRA